MDGRRRTPLDVLLAAPASASADRTERTLTVLGGIGLVVGVVVALWLFGWVLHIALLTLFGLVLFVAVALFIAALVFGLLHLVLGPYYFVTKRRPTEAGDYSLDDVQDKNDETW